MELSHCYTGCELNQAYEKVAMHNFCNLMQIFAQLCATFDDLKYRDLFFLICRCFWKRFFGYPDFTMCASSSQFFNGLWNYISFNNSWLVYNDSKLLQFSRTPTTRYSEIAHRDRKNFMSGNSVFWWKW